MDDSRTERATISLVCVVDDNGSVREVLSNLIQRPYADQTTLWCTKRQDVITSSTMPCFLDSGPFGTLLTAVDRKKLPPEVLSESLLSPVTALELAQNAPKQRVLLEHSTYLRPLTRLHSRVVLDFDWTQDFVAALGSKGPDYFRGLLNVLHTRCVMHARFLEFHQSRYGKNPPKTIAGSRQFTGDIRDSMQLIISLDVPFITFDQKLMKKLPPNFPGRVVPCSRDATPELVMVSMQIANAGMFTADKWQ